jgi:aerobic-type carbon monoxide dehydrogenase small subunit (CoxS/CutS family)
VARTVDTDPGRPLLEVLREDLNLTGSKYGCGEGQCRACAVLIDGKALPSCVTPVRSAAGKKVITIEGLAAGGRLTRLQQAFVDEGAMQCGYCIPGMILTATALLERNPHPSDAQIVEAMNGNLCRCCGYPKILAAIRRAAKSAKEETAHVTRD